jgi:hypothetical protein
VRRYRQINALNLGTPLPADVSYQQMLEVVLQRDLADARDKGETKDAQAGNGKPHGAVPFG